MSWKHYSVINRCIRAMPLEKQASLCRGDSETDHKVTRHTMQQVSSTVDGNHLAWTMSIWKEDEHSSFGWQFSTGVQTFSGQPKFYGSQLDEWAQINVAQLQQEPQPQQPQENAVSLLTFYCLPTCSIFFLSAGPLPSLPSTTRVFISHLSLHPDCHNLQSHWRTCAPCPGAVWTDHHKVSHTLAWFLSGGSGAKHSNTGELQTELTLQHAKQCSFFIKQRGKAALESCCFHIKALRNRCFMQHCKLNSLPHSATLSVLVKPQGEGENRPSFLDVFYGSLVTGGTLELHKTESDLEKIIPASIVKAAETDTRAVMSCIAQTWVFCWEYSDTLFSLAI